jgi:hypothetical protein
VIKITELRLGEFSLLAHVISQRYAPRSGLDYPGSVFSFSSFHPCIFFLIISLLIYSFSTVFLKICCLFSYLNQTAQIESQQGQTIPLEVLGIYFSPTGKISRQCLKGGHERFILNLFRFGIHHHPVIQHYGLSD